MNDITAFFDFLKYCLGNKGNMSRVIAGMDWHGLYSFASKQALQGLCRGFALMVSKDWEKSIEKS